MCFLFRGILIRLGNGPGVKREGSTASDALTVGVGDGFTYN